MDVVLNGRLSLGAMTAILPPLESLWDPLAPLGTVHLDLSGVEFIFPAAATLLTTTVLRLRQDGFDVRITRPGSEDADHYLNRIDFYALTEVEANYPWRRHNAGGRFREVVQVQTEAEGDQVVAELMTILGRNVEGVAGIYDAAQHAFLEIVNKRFPSRPISYPGGHLCTILSAAAARRVGGGR